MAWGLLGMELTEGRALLALLWDPLPPRGLLLKELKRASISFSTAYCASSCGAL